jgi:hypothetical protein
MAVIARSPLVGHRLRVLEGRGTPSGFATERPPAPLPDWAAEVLLMAGMTVDEVERGKGLYRESSGARSIEAAEDDLLRREASTLDQLGSLAEAAASRLRRSPYASGARLDPDVARSLALMDRLAERLARLREVPVRGIG